MWFVVRRFVFCFRFWYVVVVVEVDKSGVDDFVFDFYFYSVLWYLFIGYYGDYIVIMDDKCGIFYFGVIIGENCCIG